VIPVNRIAFCGIAGDLSGRALGYRCKHPKRCGVQQMNDSVGQARAVRVWDLPTRVFHWLLVALIVGQIVTATIAGNAMAWHFRFGYGLFALLGFRLTWGLVGGHWSRFSNFIYAPATVLRYLRGQHRVGDHFEVGHNPLGSASVFAMLALVGVQIACGLVADDEVDQVGPLNRFVSNTLAHNATALHTGPVKWLLFTLIALHVAAIVYYRVKKQVDLVRPMVVGDKWLAGDAPHAADSVATRVGALLLLVLWGALVAWIVSLGG
jgi:cytochrome b